MPGFFCKTQHAQQRPAADHRRKLLPNLVKRRKTKTEMQRIAAIELSREEFAKALQSKPDSMFVERMFEFADADRNGFISHAEFVNLLALLSRGTIVRVP